MKKLILTIFTLAVACFANAQDDEMQTLFKKDNSVGIYLGFNAKPTLIQNQETMLFSSELSMVFGHNLNAGVIGAFSLNSVYPNYYDQYGNPLLMEVGYGGFKLEPVLFSKKLAHVTIPITFGGGATTLHSGNFDYSNGNWNNSYDFYDADFFFLAEPGINLEVNVYKHLRLDLGGSYRFTSNTYLLGSPNYSIQGFAGNIGLKFGWF